MNRIFDLPGVEKDVPLARYTAARLGGPAEALFIARDETPVEHIISVLKTAWDNDIPVRVLGGGANVLVSDAGVRGLVVLNRRTQIQFGPWTGRRTISADAGTSLQQFARVCAQRGYTGMEWAVGVPGTVGGAVVNNAGAHGSDMAASVVDVVVFEADHGPQLYTVSDMAYAYRSSALKDRSDGRFMVLLATFHLDEDNPDRIRERMADYNAYRRRSQPPGASLGSIFKNPPGDYAGRLIERAGLKGFSVGGARVSPVHANFFINEGDATASDYYALIQHVRRQVFDVFGVLLEPEIEIVGAWDRL